MTGSDWSLLGVAFSVIGTLVAYYGTRVSSNETKRRSDQLVEASAALVTKSEEIAKLSQENATLSKELAAYATGEGSYFYLHPRAFGSDQRAAIIQHVGENPARDTELLIFDLSQQIPDLAARRVQNLDMSRQQSRQMVDVSYPRGAQRKLMQFPFENAPDKDNYAYAVQITGASYQLRQIIQFIKVNGAWTQAYIVERVEESDDGRHLVRIHESFDDGFPDSGNVIIRRRVQ
jgi:hypothetical protein